MGTKEYLKMDSSTVIKSVHGSSLRRGHVLLYWDDITSPKLIELTDVCLNGSDCTVDIIAANDNISFNTSYDQDFLIKFRRFENEPFNSDLNLE